MQHWLRVLRIDSLYSVRRIIILSELVIINSYSKLPGLYIARLETYNSQIVVKLSFKLI